MSVVVAKASPFERADVPSASRRRNSTLRWTVAGLIALSSAGVGRAQDAGHAATTTATPATTTTNSNKPKDTRQRNRGFGSLARIIYGYSPDGESFAGFGVFQLLPERFFVSLSTEFLTGQRSGTAFAFKHNDTTLTGGRALGTTGWLGALSPVARYQHSSDAADEVAAGMQWEISRT